MQFLVYRLLTPYYLVSSPRLALADMYAYCVIPPGVHEYDGGDFFLFCPRHQSENPEKVLVRFCSPAAVYLLGSFAS